MGILPAFLRSGHKEARCHVKTILSCIARGVAHLLCAARHRRVVHDFRHPGTGQPGLSSASGGSRKTRMTSPRVPKIMNNAPSASSTEKRRKATSNAREERTEECRLGEVRRRTCS